MKVKLIRAARIRHEAGEIVEVSPAEAGFLLSTGSAVQYTEPVKEEKPEKPEDEKEKENPEAEAEKEKTPEAETEKKETPEAEAQAKETPEAKNKPKSTRGKK